MSCEALTFSTCTELCTTDATKTTCSAALRPVKELLVREDQSHHCFDHRGSADADAGVVAPFGHDLGRLAVAGDRLHRCEDRTGRLESHADADRLPGGDPPGDPAGMIGE